MVILQVQIYGKPSFVIVENGIELEPYSSYLKYMASTANKGISTCRTYATALKLYITFLDNNKLQFKQININVLTSFISWLRSDEYILKGKKQREARTVNTYMQAVIGFYNYLYRNDLFIADLNKIIYENITEFQSSGYKGFLAHSIKKRNSKRNILKVTVKKKEIDVLDKTEIQQTYNNCRNIRDKLIIKTLYESGVRKGELLSLYVEDFICDHKKGHHIQLSNHKELHNGAILKSGERKIVISQELLNLYDDYIFNLLDKYNIISGPLFVKIAGKNCGQPMNTNDINKLMLRLNKRTGIHTYCHIFRHTSGSVFYNTTKNVLATKDRLGHSSIQTTAQYYVNISLEDQRREFEKVQSNYSLKD